MADPHTPHVVLYLVFMLIGVIAALGIRCDRIGASGLGGVGAPGSGSATSGGGGAPPGLLAPGGSAGESAEGDGKLDPRVRKFLTDLNMQKSVVFVSILFSSFL